ncbi:GxxExxY protein [Methanohalobium sp.]|uniref:GxxExxY protein n=1 Tax=Methanohalobium sp. TaxID=2837493 RepID=UPI0025E896BC|nr:GxxExxY protein [Methanohalobium sp.]
MSEFIIFNGTSETLTRLIFYVLGLILLLSFLVVVKNKLSQMKTDRVFNKVSEFLENETSFRYGKHKTEKDYQQNLEGKLEVLTERHGYNIKYEAVPKNSKYRVDFVVENLVGIEMKFYQGGHKIEEQLYKQIVNYSKYYPKMIGLVLNSTNKNDKDLKKEIEEIMDNQDVIGKKDYRIIVKSIGKSSQKKD